MAGQRAVGEISRESTSRSASESNSAGGRRGGRQIAATFIREAK
jgi:hypothetical protein